MTFLAKRPSGSGYCQVVESRNLLWDDSVTEAFSWQRLRFILFEFELQCAVKYGLIVLLLHIINYVSDSLLSALDVAVFTVHYISYRLFLGPLQPWHPVMGLEG